MKHISRYLFLIPLLWALTGAGLQEIHAGTLRTVRLSADTAVCDYTPQVRRILEDAPEGRLHLVFEKGTYHFYPDGAAEKYMSVSNNDNGLKRVVFDLAGRQNVEIDGGGSEFIFHGRLVPFSIEGCGDISLKNFSIDYAEPFLFEAEVIASDSVGRKLTVKVHPDCRYEIEDGQVYFWGYGWKSNLGVNTLFDKSTRRPYFNTDAYYQHNWKNPLSAKAVGKDTLELSGVNSTLVPPVGSVITDKGYANRLVPGFAIRDSRGIEICDVDVYHSGAMALIAEFSENLSLTRFNVMTREGSGRMVSSTADATHFTDCKGLISLTDCRFESMLDDATNVHGTCMPVKRVQGDSLLVAGFGHHQQRGNLFASKGDRLRLLDRKTLQSVGYVRVEEIRRANEDWYEILVDDPEALRKMLPAEPEPAPELALALENVSRSADVQIRGCSVRYNRARSFLISTPGQVRIEDCYLSSMMAGLRICGDANFWYESGYTRDIVIRGNVFEDLAIGGGFPQAILQIDPVIPKEARTTDFFYHGRIVFEDNTVRTFDSQVIYACSVKELTIRGNRFIDSESHQEIYPGLSVIDAQFCGRVTVAGNDFSEWKSGATISLHKCLETRLRDCRLKKVDLPNPFFFEN